MNTRSHAIRWSGLIAALVAITLTSCQRKDNIGDPGAFPDANLKTPPTYKGVVLASQEGTLPVSDKPCQVRLGEVLVVRVHNFDGWLIAKLENNQITDDSLMIEEQRKNYLLLQKLHGERLQQLIQQGHLKAGASSNDFLKLYEESTEAKPATEAANPTTPAKPTLTPLPQGVTAKKLRDAKNAYDTLLATAKRQIYLVLNNSQFRKIKADNADEGRVNDRVKPTSEETTVHEFKFRLARREGDEEAWNGLYDGTRAIHNVRVSVGVELGQRVFVLDTMVFPQAAAKVQRLRLELYDERWLLGVLLALVASLVGALMLGSQTGLLRDNDLPLRADGLAQFSLSRIQLAFWTFLVVGAFLIIWLVTDRLDTLNTTILGVLGISSGTTLASKLANTLTLSGGATNKEPTRAARRGKSIEELRGEVNQQLTALKTDAENLEKKRTAAPSSALEAEAAALTLRIQRLQDDLDYLSGNRVTRFFVDLLSENGRVTLHRLQIVVWTVVLGIAFVSKVRRELAMPVFSETLLGLMGLSSLTYVALKVPELKRVEAEVKAEPKP